MSRKSNVVSYIRYQTKKSDGKRYATFCPADRRHGGKDVYLGIAVDELGGIFYNRNGGYFRFTVESGKEPLDASEAQYAELMAKLSGEAPAKRLILDFGDAWFLDQAMESSGLKALLLRVLPEESDTLLALAAFKLLDCSANSYAQRWYDGSYAQYVYPKARLASPRISEFMERLGKEETKRAFFDAYVPYLRAMPGLSDNVLIDSAGLPNDIHFEYSQISNHNGLISREARLIYVVERKTGMPVYFRYVAGNIVDVTTLRVTINHLKAQGVDVRHGILDAGYCSEKNIRGLRANGIPFLIRLPNNAMAKKLIAEHGGDVLGEERALEYGDRLLFMKEVEVELFGCGCHVYIAVDYQRMQDEEEHFYRKAAKKINNGKKKKSSGVGKGKFGYFVLVSSEKLDCSEVMPLYYMRQTIEQTFDFAKNDVALLPLRNHSGSTFRGHLLLSFIATVILITIKMQLKTHKALAKLPVVQALNAMRYIKCDVFPKMLVTSEPSKYANLVINELKLDVPGTVVI